MSSIGRSRAVVDLESTATITSVIVVDVQAG
jgi:hypothetical protein